MSNDSCWEGLPVTVYPVCERNEKIRASPSMHVCFLHRTLYLYVPSGLLEKTPFLQAWLPPSRLMSKEETLTDLF